jgi:Ca2+-transporting ATPase
MLNEYQRSAEEIVAALATDTSRGLTTAEARTRLAQFGDNELAAERPLPAWKRFARQFNDVLVILLLIATAISAALWMYERDASLPYEAIAITVVVLLNAVMGYLQEQRAESAVAALRQMTAAHAHAVRDSTVVSIDAAEVVPGDIIVIEEGDTVPADARVVESTSLKMAEAALTGESLPVSKEVDAISGEVALGDRTNMIYAGTSATYGRGRGVVVATGMRTEMGRIAGMLAHVPAEHTPLQKELDHVGKLLGAVVVVIAIMMIATIVLVEHVRGISALFDVLILGVALAVAAVPEGLPAVVTAVLSMGVQRMARRNAIVRHLSAVETLGSASVIASDKTGTLTRNEMTVREVATASGRVTIGGTGYAPVGEVRSTSGAITGSLQTELERALAVADRANNASLYRRGDEWVVQGDPTEAALLVASRKAGLQPDHLARRFARVGEVPFSSDRKLMSTLHTDADTEGRVLLFTKGAPDVLLARSTHELVGEAWRPLSETRRREILETNDGLAARAMRTLGVAYRASLDGTLTPGSLSSELERDLVFAGLIGMIDPPRDEAREAVARAKGAGIRPVMITGDHPRTAVVIAQELGLAPDGRALTGTELDRLPGDELEEIVAGVSVFARVNPEHKLRIVEALQRHGAVVAMTGDGVNDAPALKTADIGVAMGITGTDVSKQAADIVLADDNFATIVAAVEEGRSIFSNIRKFLRYLLSSNIGEVMTMFFGVVFSRAIGLEPQGGPVVLPLLATQLLWINLVTDGAPALALGLDPPNPTLMQCPPRPPSERVITARMWAGIFFVGVVMAVGTLYVLDASLPGGMVEGTGTLRYAQAKAFTVLILFQLFNVFNARSDRRSAFGDLFSNQWLWAGVLLSLALQCVVLYTPFLQQAFSTVSLSAADWLQCVAVASSVLWLREAEKLVYRRLTA